MAQMVMCFSLPNRMPNLSVRQFPHTKVDVPSQPITGPSLQFGLNAPPAASQAFVPGGASKT